MNLALLLIIIIFPCLTYSSDNLIMDNAKNAGEIMSNEWVSKHWKDTTNFSSDDILPKNSKDQIFDGKKAKSQISDNLIPSSETYQFVTDEKMWQNRQNNLLDPEEHLFKKSEEISKNAEKYIQEIEEETSEYHLEKCYEIGTSFPLEIIRKLDVQISNLPEIRKVTRVCQGHEDSDKYYFKNDAEHAEKKIRSKFSSDKTIKSFDVWIKDGSGLFEDYKVKYTWTHNDDFENCNKFKLENKLIQKASYEEKDEWHNEKENQLIDTPQCTFIKKACIEQGTTKQIDGKTIFRQCWSEQWSYLCRYERKKDCGFLSNKNCTLIDKKCIENSKNGCSLWELTFKCLSNISKKFSKIDNSKIFGINEEEKITFIPNTSFPNVCTTLTVFEAIKHEIESAQSSDPIQIQVFKGNKNQCSKSIAENLLYDCCFSFGGLANDLKLSHCTADEIALSEKRERGLCYYIGVYEEKLLNLTTRKEHVFCCFPTKLSCVFQEQARQQLGIGWGDANQPDCRGLSVTELSKLDFTKLDLSEAFENLPDVKIFKDKVGRETKLKEKSEALEKRMKRQMQNLENHHVS